MRIASLARNVGIVSLMVVSAAVIAQNQPRGGQPGRGGAGGAGGGFDSEQFVERLMQNDANGDGMLTADELPGRLAGILDTADTNGDGALDAKELTAFAETRGQGRGGRGGAGGAGGPGGAGGAAGAPASVGGAMRQVGRAMRGLSDSTFDAS
ncbi:MAG: hypothetical protein KDA25_13115, partial [Phycisphaerales bacterium]|nr:hypothetical protein [Phycisphaerales bacterium]